MKTKLALFTTILMAAVLTRAADTDKTLVSWVTLTDKNLRGGSALIIQKGAAFDGIVFGEVAADKWMAGSDNFRRTQREQEEYPAETAASGTLIQMAIVYADKTITIYRNDSGFVFAHVSSDDMMRWKWHPTVLAEIVPFVFTYFARTSRRSFVRPH